MKKILLRSLKTFLVLAFPFVAYAQPGNDACASATAMTLGGPCINGTTVSANDNITSTAGCQSGGNGNSHKDVWYTFTATGTTFTATLTSSSPFAGNIEFVLISGTCTAGTVVNSACGASPLSVSIAGLTSGTTYMIAVSNQGNGTAGPFTICNYDTYTPVSSCGAGTGPTCATPVAITTTLSAQTCYTGCNFGNPAGPNFLTGSACYDFPNATSWVSFSSGSATLLDLSLTSTSLTTPHVAVFISSDCSNFTQLGCTSGTGGAASFNDLAITGSSTILIAVSDDAGATGSYSLCVTPLPDPSPCNVSDVITEVSSSDASTPLGGPYSAGESVNFCYTINQYKKASCNWLMGIVPTFGDCWSASSFNAQGKPVTSSGPAVAGNETGTWAWYPAGSVDYNASGSLPAGTLLPGGWFFQCNSCGLSNADPDNSWGDGGAAGSPANDCDANGNGYTWQVCFTLIAGTSSNCTNGTTNCGLSMKTYADGEIGGYINLGCTGDLPQYYYASFLCCTPPTVTTSAASPTICSGTSTTLTANCTANCTGATYAWAPSTSLSASTGSSVTASPTVTTTYTVTSTASCSSTSTVVVTVVNTPTVSVTSPTVCSGSTTTITATGNATTYTWNPSTGISASTGTSVTTNTTVTTTTSYTVTAANGTCTASATSTVTVNPKPTVTAASVSVCPSGTVAMSASGAVTYTWSPATSLSASTGATPTFTAGSTNTYTVTGTSALSCTNTATATVTVNPSPTLTVNSPTICAGTSSTLTATSNATSFTWSPSAGLSASTGASVTTATTIATTTSYTVTGTSALGCTVAATSTLTVNPTPTVTINSPSVCAGATVSMNASGASTYTWSPSTALSASTGSAPVFTAGANNTYTVTGTSVAGCTSTATSTVTVNPLPIAAASVSGQLSCGSPVVTVDAVGSSSGANFAYSWTSASGIFTSGTNSSTASVSAVADYTLTVTNTVTGCSATASVSVTSNGSLPTAVIQPSADLTCNTTTLTIDGTGSTTGGTVTYTWSTTGGNITGGTMGITTTIDAPGNYTLTVSDGGCSASSNITVNEYTVAPVATISAPAPITCTTTTVELDASASDSVDVTYAWTTSGGNITSADLTQDSVLVDAIGDYTITITNTVTGCINTASVTVSNNLVTPTASIAVADSITCLMDTLVLDGAGSSQGAGYAYAWTTSNGNIVSGAANDSAMANQVGDYVLTVTDLTNGCTQSATVTVYYDTLRPAASISAAAPLTCTVTTTTLDGSGSSSGADYTYDWTTSNGSFSGSTNSNTATADSTGDYTILVTDITNGCTQSATVNVSIDTLPPTATVASPPAPLTCTVTTTALDGSGSSSGVNYSYSWTTSNGNITAGAGTSTATAGAIGDYMLVVTDNANGCTDTALVTVGEDIAKPNVSIVPPSQLTCTVTTVVLDGTGSDAGLNISYNWTTSNGNIVSGGATNSATVDAVGNYTLTVSNSTNGCSDTLSVAVTTDNAAPTVNIVSPPTITCLVDSVVLDGSGSSSGPLYLYNWATSNGTIGGPVANDSIYALAAGTYTLTVSDLVSGCFSTATVTVAVDTVAPVVLITPPGQLDCGVPSIIIDGSSSTPDGNISFNWSTITGTLNGSTTDSVATAAAAGFYMLTVANLTNGCTDTDSAEVTASPNAIFANIATPSSITCTVTTVTLDGSASSTGADITYSWTTTGGNFTSANGNNTITVDAGGTYSIIVTNTVANCSDTASVTVAVDTLKPDVNPSTFQYITCTTPTVTLTGSSLTANPDYLWNGPSGFTAITSSIAVSNAGIYTLTVTNPANGCSKSDTVHVVTDTLIPVAVSAGADQSITCSTATVSLGGSSSSANVSYQWAGPNGYTSSGPNAAITASGNYTLTVTGTNGCQDVDMAQVYMDTVPPVASAFPSGTVLTCVTSSVTLSGSASPTASSLTWTGFPTGVAQVTATATGTYTLTVTSNNNGCTDTAQVIIGSDTIPPTITASTTDDTLNCAITSTTLNGTTNGTGFLWQGPNGFSSTTQNPSVSSTGTYTVTSADPVNGCTNTATITIYQGSDPTASFNANPTSGVAPVTVNFTSTSVGAATYTWTFGDGQGSASQNPTNTYVAAGTYTAVLVINAGTACEDSATTVITLIEPATVVIPNVFSPNGDNINEIFKITSTGYKDMSVDVFNRWGNKLYTFDGIGGYWDGKDASDGTYFFMLKGTTNLGEAKEMEGYFLLTR
jgi:gliding motility-associated-like protein